MLPPTQSIRTQACAPRGLPLVPQRADVAPWREHNPNSKTFWPQTLLLSPPMKSYRALRAVLAFVPAVPNQRGQATAALHPGKSRGGGGGGESVELRFGSLTKAAHFYAICERGVYTWKRARSTQGWNPQCLSNPACLRSAKSVSPYAEDRGWGGAGRNRYKKGAGDTGKTQGWPRLRVQSKKLQCASGFRLPVCKARTTLPDSVTPALAQNRVRLFFARGARLRGGGSGAAGCRAPPSPRPPGLSWAARRTKRFPLPPPRSRPRREGEGGLEEEEGRRKGRRAVLPAGLGRIAARREGKEEGLGGLGERGGGQDS